MTPRVESLRELKARVRLEDVVAAHMTLHGQGTVRTGQCPIHGGRHNSFAVYLTTQTWYCFSAKCERGGDVIDFLGYLTFGAAWNSRDREQLREVLAALACRADMANKAGGTVPLKLADSATAGPRVDRGPAGSGEHPLRPAELDPNQQLGLHLAASLYHTTLRAGRGLAGAARDYLRDVRGWTEPTIVGHGLGYADGRDLQSVWREVGLDPGDERAAPLFWPASERERLAGRIIFCERDRAGRVLHLIGRRFAPWLKATAPKYLALSAIMKPLYGYARLDRRPSAKPVFLVEGPPDLLTLNQWGEDALANLGTRLTPHHAALLARLRRPLMVIPNNDAGSDIGRTAAERWLTLIGRGQMVRLPEEFKDVNELAQQPGGRAHWVALLARSGWS